MAELTIASRWIGELRPPLEEATAAELGISLGEHVLTRFVDAGGEQHDGLEIPAYFLAEWLAENWWALLWEPRKSDDENHDEPDYLSRHSIVPAQNGYPLPSIVIAPNGDALDVSCTPRVVQHAGIRFLTRAERQPTSRSRLTSTLRRFVSATVERLEQSGISDTQLGDAWRAIEGTQKDEELYCQMVGALGLSPYDVPESIDAALQKVAEVWDEQIVMDLCLAAKPANFLTLAMTSRKAVDALEDAATLDSDRLRTNPFPSDNLHSPAWRRGKRAAEALRSALNIRSNDVAGSWKVFEALGFNPQFGNSNDRPDSPNEAVVAGAVRVGGDSARISLLQKAETSRRFAGARGIYYAWSSANGASKLLTQAVTRDQQASRAFAAEITAPIEYIRRASRRTLTFEKIHEMADELCVGADVVYKQALNNNITIAN